MSNVNVCCESVEIVNKKWSQGSSCLATCSRGLSPSSGDHDGNENYSFCSEKCSCCSDYYLTEYCDRPCIIIDSETRLRKSRWKKFKSYLKRHMKFERNKVENRLKKSKKKDNCDNIKCCSQTSDLQGASNACRARRSGRHARVPFTSTQAAALEAAYSRSPYLAPPALRALAAALQLRDDRIKIWFQNRRARERREKTGNISPPKAMTLQSTQRNIPNEIWVPNQSQTHYNFNLSDRDTSDNDKKYSHSFSTSDDESNGSSLDIETVND